MSLAIGFLINMTLVGSEKFACTELESARDTLSALPNRQTRSHDVPLDSDLDIVLQAAKRRKAVGKDEIPTEVFLDSPKARADLFSLVRLCWLRETVPEPVTGGIFVAIWKRKGSS